MMMIMLDLPALMLTLSFPFYRLSRSDDFSCQISFDDSFLCAWSRLLCRLITSDGSLRSLAVFKQFRAFSQLRRCVRSRSNCLKNSATDKLRRLQQRLASQVMFSGRHFEFVESNLKNSAWTYQVMTETSWQFIPLKMVKSMTQSVSVPNPIS